MMLESLVWLIVRNFKTKYRLEIFVLSCAGKVEEFMAPIQATYKLEVWGAQGSWGGYGGYCYAEDMVSKNGTIYICVGQNTQSTSPSYNNGNISFSFYMGLSGGGATSLTSSNRGIRLSCNSPWIDNLIIRR